ncbi:MAG: prolipoprotein diacylglyceryl transferase [Cyclobacteriaceae bacterium]|nr:prolipoprotein diacylglyceryl transferase [Cyclobacteriaceae bacterium]
METFILEDITFPNYQFFYALAFLVVTLILLYEGKKQKLPAISWLMVMGTGFLFFVVGCKIIVLSLEDWNSILQLKPLHHPTGATVIGGIIFSFSGILLARYVLKLPWRMLDAYAFVIPIGMFIQRFGCLLAGCCYGNRSDLPWAVHYGKTSTVYYQQLHEQLIPEGAAHSLGIHPVQVYESIGCLLIVYVLIRLKNYFNAPGNFILFSGLSYYVIRFVLEFFRADAGHAFGGASIGWLNQIQLIFAILVVASIGIIIFREKRTRSNKNSNQPLTLSSLRYVGYFLCLAFLFALTSIWLNRTETLVVLMVFAPIAVLLLIHIYTVVTVPNLRLATLSLMGCSFLFMSQATIENPDKSDADKKNAVIETFYEISGGGMFGNHELKDQTGEIPGSGGSCGSAPTPLYTNVHIHYSSGSLGLSRTWVKADGQTLKVGLYGTGGSIREEVASDYQYETSNRVNFWNINPTFRLEQKDIGFGIGALVGDLHRMDTRIDGDDFNNISGTGKPSLLKSSSFLPQLSLRLGNREKWFVEGGINDLMPTGLPATTYKVGVGFGFNNKSGSYLSLGHASYSALYLAPKVVINNSVTLEPFLGFGNSFLNSIESETNFIGSLNLSVRLGQRKISRE